MNLDMNLDAALDVPRLRDQFPALNQGLALFDGPGGTQVPVQVADRVAATMTSGVSNRGQVTPGEERAEAIIEQARAAVADLLGCAAQGVVFARSMTQATYDMARTLASTWGPGDEVVVTRLDHDANIGPWVQAAAAAGASVRWAGFDADSGELSADHIRAELSEATRLVAVTAASNVLGVRPDIAAISEVVHAHRALLYVDGVHLTPHAPVDLASLGADFYACSPYKFFGPHLGVVVADPALLETLRPAKLLPSSDAVPDRFELGTLPFELLAGTTAAVDFIAGIASEGGDRRHRVLASMAAVEQHEAALRRRLLDGLAHVDGLLVHAAGHPGTAGRRTPTVYFSHPDRVGREISTHLAARGVHAPAGHFYAIEASRWLGLGETGAVRAGISAYTSAEDVDRLLAGVAEILQPRRA